ncbi:MAG TPA: hypothetical protein VH107_10990 [Lacipirellulaceae bacterium]|jgi:hypothetical protein|nr:hypothetical protein [Lacipirellulaceae bacterium]
MTKVNFPNRRSIAVVGSRQARWWTLSLTAVVCCAFFAATRGADQVDSGWVIGVPSPFAKNPKADDSHQQYILRSVLDQTEHPLLQNSPSASAAKPDSDGDKSAGEHVAVREGANGWRRPSEAAAPSTPIAKAPLDLQAEPADVGHSHEGEAEGDGSGHESQHVPPKSAKRSNPTSLADAYDNVPLGEEDKPMPAPTNPVEPDDVTATEDASPAKLVAPANQPNAVSPPASLPSAAAASKPLTVPAPETTTPPPLTKQLVMLRSRVRSVLKGYYRKPLNSRDNDPWEVMHGMLSYGVQSRIRQGGANGEPITSVGWLCYNKPCKGQTLMYVNPQGEVRAKYGVGLQGHLGQLLAMLAQCNVSADYPIRVGNNDFTIHDLIEAEKKTCYPKSELTFKLIALQHYIDLNDKWVNDQGVDWDFSRLIREELSQPIRGAACGGTHRLSGLSLVVKKRIERGEPLDGEYAQAADFVKKYQQYAFRLQNPDGSLSTAWFRGGGDEDDINRKIKTTGHILEWLCYSLSDEELRDQRTVRAVSFLANLMYSNYDNEWEIGPRSHATHALLLYDQRVFAAFDKDGPVASYQTPTRVANNNQSGASSR